MFCNKCGKELSDNVKFCAYCGAPVQSGRVVDTSEKPGEAAAMPVQAEGLDDDATVVVTESTPAQPSAGEKEHKNREQRAQKDDEATSMTMPVIPVDDRNGTQQGTPGEANAGAQYDRPVDHYPISIVPKPEEIKPKKSRKGIVFGILIVLAAVLVALLVFLVRAVFGGSDAAKRVIYLKDDELSAVLDITAKEPVDVELERIRSEDDVYDSMLGRYSEDGKYFYFFSKIDAGYNDGTLCCIEVDKLKKDESANDAYIREIDSKVSLGSFSLLGDDSLLYKRKDDELWLYRGGKTTELADSVGSYELTDDKKYIVYIEWDDEDEDENKEGDLYWMEVSENAKAEEIDSHVTTLWAVEGSDFIVYSKSGKNAYDYYVAGIDRSPSLVAEDGVDISVTGENSFYYTVSESKEMSLYDYVIDSYAKADAEAKEPDVRDHMKSVSAESAISSSDLAYYGSMAEFLDGEAYYDDASGLYSYNNYEKYETFYYDDATGTWYGDYKQDDYYAAMDDYRAIAERDELRTELKQGTVDQVYSTLYHYQNGESEVVCENASVSTWGDKCVVYTKIDLESPKKTYPIEEIGSAESLHNQILYDDAETGEDMYYCYVSGSAEAELSDFDSVVGTYLSEDGKTLVIEGNPSDGAYELVQYAVGSDGLGEGKRITSEGSGERFQGNLFYYYDDISEDEKDLYCYENGEEKLIAKEAESLVFLADDGTVVGVTDWDSNHTSGDLTVFDEDGRGEDIVRDVEGFRYLGSGTYLFTSGDDLYYLDQKGEKTRLAKNITSYWYPGKLPGTWM